MYTYNDGSSRAPSHFPLDHKTPPVWVVMAGFLPFQLSSLLLKHEGRFENLFKCRRNSGFMQHDSHECKLKILSSVVLTGKRTELRA